MEISQEVSSAIDEAISHYFDDSISLIEGLNYSQYQTIKKVEFYSSSQFLNGNKDNLGRFKPFYNINNFRVQIAIRATDLDIKNINIEADEPEDSFKSMILNQELYRWMKEHNFSKTLNELGGIRPRYGGVLAKKVEKDGEVSVEAVQWKNVITDQSDILGGTIIERHFMSPSQMQKKEGWENVKDAIKLASKNKSSQTDPFATTSNIPQIEVLEVYMDVDIDGTWTPMQYMVANGGEKKILLHEEEKEKPYKFIAWEHVSGRGLGRGVVEDGFEAQMWTNDAVIAQKNAMDLAGKVIITTTSNDLQGNALTDIDNGTIIPIPDGGSFNSTQLLPSALPELGNMIDQWDKQYSEVSSSFAAISGEELPSGTPFRSLALQSKQNASYFDYKREEFGIFIKEIIEEWILPELTKKLSSPHTLVTELPQDKLDLLDDLIIAEKLETGIKKFVKANKRPPTREQVLKERQRLINFFNQTGKTRYLDIPKGFYKGIKSRVSIITTGEQDDKQVDSDRLLGFAEFIAQAQASGNPTLLNIAKQVASKMSLDIDLNSSGVGGGQAPQVNAPQGEPAIKTEIDSNLPVAQQ
jgi:hypothetical protein